MKEKIVCKMFRIAIFVGIWLIGMPCVVVADNTPNPEAAIVVGCEDIGGDGIASAYSQHRFLIEGMPENGNTGKWEFEKPLVSGDTEVSILEEIDGMCILPPITDADIYQVDNDGMIPCVLKYSSETDGKIQPAIVRNIYWDVKPRIEDVRVVNITDDLENSSYSVEYEVSCKGADVLRISLEEEYSTAVKSEYVDNPGYIKGNVQNITLPFYAWIDFSVWNKYGETCCTIEFEPYHSTYSIISPDDKKGSNVEEISGSEEEYDFVIAYSLSGVRLYKGKELPASLENDTDGPVIISCFKNGQLVKSIKRTF